MRIGSQFRGNILQADFGAPQPRWLNTIYRVQTIVGGLVFTAGEVDLGIFLADEKLGMIRMVIPFSIFITSPYKAARWLNSGEGFISGRRITKVILANVCLSIINVAAGYFIANRWMYPHFPTR